MIRVRVSDVKIPEGYVMGPGPGHVCQQNARAFMESIREHGVQNPIYVTNTLVLIDGRKRLQACTEEYIPARIM